MISLTLTLIGRLASVVAAAAAVAVLAACAAPPETSTGTAAQAQPAAAQGATPTASPAPAGRAYKVRIANFVFVDPAITVPVGSTVIWVNEDDIPHTVVSDDHTTFRSKVLDTDETFSFTFTKAGDYPYFCSVHPHMTGKVVVTPS